MGLVSTGSLFKTSNPANRFFSLAIDFTPYCFVIISSNPSIAIADDNLKQAAQVNTRDNFAPVLAKCLESLFLDRMAGNEQIFMQMMNNNEFYTLAFEKLLTTIYERLQGNDKAG